jgi:hypothetical protein
VDLFGVAARTAEDPKAESQRGHTWRLGPYETDARMLFCRTSETVSQVAMVDGSVARTADRHALLIRLPRQTPDLHLDLGRVGAEAEPARIGGHVFGVHVQLGGRDVPIAVERRAR